MKWERPRGTMNVCGNRWRKPPRESVATQGVIRRREAKRPPIINLIPPMILRGRRNVTKKLAPPSEARGSIYTIRIWAEGGKSPN